MTNRSVASKLLILTLLCGLVAACGPSGEEASTEPAAEETAGGIENETGVEGEEEEGEEEDGEDGESPGAVAYPDGEEEAPEEGEQGTPDEDDG